MGNDAWVGNMYFQYLCFSGEIKLPFFHLLCVVLFFNCLTLYPGEELHPIQKFVTIRFSF